MNQPTPIITLDEVTYAYPTGPDVLAEVRGAIQPGAITALIGPNGSGKSTLLRVMLGQLAPRRGAVRLGGQAVGRLPARRRAQAMAYVPQRSAIGFAFSVRQVVQMGRFALRADPAAVDRAMTRCDLLDLADRPYVELSVGQQQRVVLARAIAQLDGAGELLLLDEPTSAMDLAHAHRVMELLGELAGGGVAVVAVVHDINLAARYADRVWLLDRGRLAAAGPWAEVLRPAALERVYGVSLRQIDRPAADGVGRGRPMFDVAALQAAAGSR